MPDYYAPPAEPASRPSFQVVGRSCQQCTKKISRQPDGIGCLDCQQAYHLGCLADPDRCPTCRQSMSALEQRAGEAQARAAEALVGRGRTLVWAAIFMYAAVDLFVFVLKLPRGLDQASVATTVVRAGLALAVYGMTLRGSKAARRLLSFLYGLSFIGGALYAAFAAPDARAVFLVAVVAPAGFGLWVFTYSAAAGAYLDWRSRRPALAGRDRPR